MRDFIETRLDVSLEYPLWRTRFAQCREALFNCIRRRSFLPEPIRVRVGGCLCNWVEGEQVEGLHSPARHARNTQWTLAAIAFRYVDATKWFGVIAPLS